MRVIAFIENEDVIKKNLKHLGLWEVKRKPMPRANVYPPLEGPRPSMFSPHMKIILYLVRMIIFEIRSIP